MTFNRASFYWLQTFLWHRFEEPFDVIHVLTINQKEMKEVVKTSTSSHEFTEKFQKTQILSGEKVDFNEDIILNVTSSFLELAIKKHTTNVKHVLLVRINSDSVKYSLLFLSERNLDGKSFYTSTLMTLRVQKV